MVSELTKWCVAVGVAVLLALIADTKAPLATGPEGNRLTAATAQSTIDLPVTQSAARWWR